jgi:hypothetical protein
MLTALCRCKHSKARVLLRSLSARARRSGQAALFLPYDAMPVEARAALFSYYEQVAGRGAGEELLPPGRLLFLQPHKRSTAAGDVERWVGCSVLRACD